MEYNFYEKNKKLNINFSQNLSISNCGYHDFKVIKGDSSKRILNYYSVHLVVEGKGYYNIGNKTYEIKAGDVFFLIPNEPLCYYPNPNEPWRYFWIDLYGENIKEFFDIMKVSSNTPIKKCANYKTLIKMFESFFEEGKFSYQMGYKAMSIFYEILFQFSEENKSNNLLKDISISQRVKDLIHLNYKNPDLDISLITSILNISHSYLCKLFKEQTNTTIIKYILDYRLNKSLEILQNGNYLIKEISDMVGFNNEIHFMKMFKKKYNLTVKEYQKTLAK